MRNDRWYGGFAFGAGGHVAAPRVFPLSLEQRRAARRFAIRRSVDAVVRHPLLLVRNWLDPRVGAIILSVPGAADFRRPWGGSSFEADKSPDDRLPAVSPSFGWPTRVSRQKASALVMLANLLSTCFAPPNLHTYLLLLQFSRHGE